MHKAYVTTLLAAALACTHAAGAAAGGPADLAINLDGGGGTAIAHSMWPGVPLVPTMGTGFSDDRQTRNAGIPRYDVSGVREFDESVEFTYRLIKAMGVH